MNNIVYSGAGICKYSCSLISNWLHRYKKCNRTIYCIPGGKGSDILENVNGIVINNIIKNGGLYLGICCGAYLAANKIHFNNSKKNGLGLINIESYGPIYSNNTAYKYNCLSEIFNIQITDIVSGKQYNAYYNGGCSFNITPELIVNNNDRYCYKRSRYYDKDKIIIEANYSNNLPCIISKRYGKGVIILSGIHPEHPESMCNKIFDRIIFSYTNI